MAEYTHPLFLGDPGEHGLYQDLIKVYRGEIKGKEARDIVNAATGEFPQQAFDMAKREAIQRTDTPQGRISTYNSRTDFKKKAKQGKSWPMMTTDGIQNAYIEKNKIVAPGSKFDGMKATEGNLRKAFVLPKDLNQIPANVNWNLLRDTNKSSKAMMDDIHGPVMLPGTNLERRGPKGTFRDFYPGDSGEFPIPKPPVNNPVMMPGTNLERRGPRGTFRDFYPGDNMPPYPNNNMQMNTNRPNNILVKLATMQKLGLLT